VARYRRLQTLNWIKETGIVPIFYEADVEVARSMVAACADGGMRLVEMTNRGDRALEVFSQVEAWCAANRPEIVLGAGTILDAPTAALYLAAGANFVVGPSLNPEISRLCNRRKVLYMPGCATETEIATAEELGAEICKIFPGDSVGGPGFVRAVMAPCPWHRLLPTGGVDATEVSVTEWIKAGAAAVGMGSKLITSQAIKARDFDGVAGRVAQCLGWIRNARAKNA